MDTASQPPEPPDREINTGGGAYNKGTITNEGGTNYFGPVNNYNQPTRPKPEDRLPLFEMPHGKNPNFVGRETELAQMHTALQNSGAVALTALHGSGGIGKTSLAIEYVIRHRHEYSLVWWVSSENELNLQTSLAELSRRLELVALDTPTAEAIAAVLNWLATTPTRWLLIFDNADTPVQTRPYLPKGGGHCLITSRWQDWSQLTDTAIKVKLMTEGEAVELLTRRSGDKDETAAKELAKLLGYLPLALEQARSYCFQTSKKLAAYGKLFEAKRRELLDKNAPESHEQTVAATFGLALQQIEQIGEVGPKAADLLRLLAYVAPEPLAVAVLADYAEVLPEPLATVFADELERDEMLAVLANYSLIERADDQITVHRLMQAVVGDLLLQKSTPKKGWLSWWAKKPTDSEATKWARATLQLINAAFPDDVQNDVEAWPVCAALLPHAQMVCRHTEKLTNRTEPLGRLLNLTGLYLQERASFEAAKEYLERAAVVVQAIYGLHDSKTAATLNNLGRVLQNLGQLAEAKQCFERVIIILETVLSNDHPSVAIVVSNLGCVLKELGQLAEAKQCFERAINISETVYGRNHPNVAIVVSNLGCVLSDLGELAEAKQCFEWVIEIDEAAYGSNHLNVATSINNLGDVLNKLEQLQEAKQCFERVIIIFEQVWGSNHPNVATVVNNLGALLYQEGDYEGAKVHVERAYAIRRQYLGEEHPSTENSKRGLKIILEAIAAQDSAGRE